VLWAIDEILMLLKDGDWHDLREIAQKCSSSKPKVETIVSFLSKYDFLELDRKGRRARLRPLVLEFIDEIQHIRIEEAFNP